jgi:hypothetical protein
MEGESRVYGRRDRVIAQQVEGDSVLLDIESGEYFALNEVGGLIWEQCSEARSVAAIADVICDRYAVDRSTAVGDVVELLGELAQAGLVVEH